VLRSVTIRLVSGSEEKTKAITGILKWI
jgi:hypothetical protein